MLRLLMTLLLPSLILAKSNLPNSISGKNAKRGESPYQVSIQYGVLDHWQHVCGGSIISLKWILTAGHCVTEIPSIGDHRIVAGILDLNAQNTERQEIKIVEHIIHPKFPGGVAANDIALLRLEYPLKITDVVQVIDLPIAGSQPIGDAILTGWGAINDYKIKIMPNTLQTVIVPILTTEECNKAINTLTINDTNPYSNSSNICTGPLTGGISACSGDSGGPLVQHGVLVGVVSWGWTPCGGKGAPSVFTKVSNFIDFIQTYVVDLK